MSIYEKIDEMHRVESTRNSNRISARIRLYAEGTKAKIKNAEYARSGIRDLSMRNDASTDSTDPDFLYSEKLQFHVDSFFAFLYSAFDIISHIINQKYRLGLNERAVSFDSVKQSLDSGHQGSPIQQVYSKISAKIFFKNLDNYRNCSTHRREICIQTTQITATQGYDTSGTLSGVQHLLCDNPLSLSPRFAQKREVVSYCSRILDLSRLEIERIITSL